MTAASTPKGQKYGYVFRNCRFTGNSSRESVYLGRPWRDYARTVLIDCYLGPHICREGWHDWDKKNARSTLFYGEYASYGRGREDRMQRTGMRRDRMQRTRVQGTGVHPGRTGFLCLPVIRYRTTPWNRS